MSAPVIDVRPDTPLKEVVRLFAQHRISGVPVTDEGGAVLGIVSEADLLIKERSDQRPAPAGIVAWLVGEAPSERERAKVDAATAGEAMSSPAVTICGDCTLREAAALMVDARVNRLPVVEDGKLIGIVTRADLVRAYLRTDEELSRVIATDVIRDTMWMDPQTIQIRVTEGVVELAGTVDRRSTAQILGRLVAQVDGVVAVDDRLTWDLDDRHLAPAPPHEAPEPTSASVTARDHPRPVG